MSFRNGGWVFVLAAIVFVVLGGRQIQLLQESRGTARVGDGTHPESYRFTLSPCLVDRELIGGTGISKEGLPQLSYPDLVAGSNHRSVKLGMRGSKYLVPSERVIGVVANGVARAYPLSVMSWHEVVNDTVGGEPIVVTYAPLCDSAVVFDRRVGGDLLEYGFSGLVYNSNLLFYDRRAAVADESLWCQLQSRAITGPAAGDSLTIVPSTLTHWADWLARHPETTVVRPSPKMALKYGDAVYTSYYGNDLLHDVPTAPVPELAPGERFKMRVLALSIGGSEFVVPVSSIGPTEGPVTHTLGGVPLQFRFLDNPACATVSAPAGRAVSVIPTFWYAWYATHPGARLLAVD